MVCLPAFGQSLRLPTGANASDARPIAEVSARGRNHSSSAKRLPLACPGGDPVGCVSPLPPFRPLRRSSPCPRDWHLSAHREHCRYGCFAPHLPLLPPLRRELLLERGCHPVRCPFRVCSPSPALPTPSNWRQGAAVLPLVPPMPPRPRISFPARISSRPPFCACELEASERRKHRGYVLPAVSAPIFSSRTRQLRTVVSSGEQRQPH